MDTVESVEAKPHLILLHGWAMHGGIFAPLLPHLQAHFNVRCIDLPGHGSQRDSSLPLEFSPFWQHLLPTLDGPVYVLGWSLGGLFALHGALHFPDRLRGLILMNASPSFVARTDWPEGMPPAVFRQFAADLAQDYDGTLHRFFMLEAQGSEHLRADLRRLQANAFEFGRPDPEVLRQGLHLLESTDLRAQLPQLQVPSLWLAGRRDRLVNPAAMQAAAETAGGDFHCDEHGGHAPFLTHPAAIADAIRVFAEGVHA
ncbi:MAG: pimeloyl-ACP methyl ester esterase BioH [Pseudomonadota bacterium]|jgi:pimeloyl-[acyl-carrier protein] methyl ester esterase